MAKLEELLGKELFDQVQNKIKEADDDINLIINDGSYLPRHKLNEANDKIEALEEQLKNRDKQIEQLKEDTDASEKLQEKINELQKKNEEASNEWQKKFKQQKLDAEIEKHLLKNNALNPKAVKALLDIDEISLKDDGVVGLESQIESLTESDPYLFGSDGKPSKGGKDGFKGGGKTPLTQGAIEQMSNEEINERWDEIQTFLENN